MDTDGQENSTEVSSPGKPVKADYSDIPPELRPHKGKREAEPSDVAIVPQKLKLTPKQLKQIEARFGCLALSRASMTELQNLGHHLESLGIDTLTTANMFVNQQALVSVLTKIAADALKETDIDKRLKYAQPLGYLAGQLSRAGQATKEVSEKVAVESPKNGPRYRSFRPGEELQPPVAVQIINNIPK